MYDSSDNKCWICVSIREILILHYTWYTLNYLIYFQVPTFKHGDIVVNESLAACLYVAVGNQK